MIPATDKAVDAFLELLLDALLRDLEDGDLEDAPAEIEAKNPEDSR